MRACRPTGGSRCSFFRLRATGRTLRVVRERERSASPQAFGGIRAWVRGVRGRVPPRTCTNRWRQWTHARACVHEYPGVRARTGGVSARMPGRTCTDALAKVHELAASVDARQGVRARVPWRRSSNRRRQCMRTWRRSTNWRRQWTHARACVHEYPGVGPRIGGVSARMPGCACTSTLA
jgi:hypothetical protein